MRIGEREAAMLAELKDMPSFVLLMNIFQEFEDTVLGEVALERNPESLVRITRFYQYMRAVREFLKSRPESAYDALQAIKDTYVDGGAPELELSDVMHRGAMVNHQTEMFENGV